MSGVTFALDIRLDDKRRKTASRNYRGYFRTGVANIRAPEGTFEPEPQESEFRGVRARRARAHPQSGC